MIDLVGIGLGILGGGLVGRGIYRDKTDPKTTVEWRFPIETAVNGVDMRLKTSQDVMRIREMLEPKQTVRVGDCLPVSPWRKKCHVCAKNRGEQWRDIPIRERQLCGYHQHKYSENIKRIQRDINARTAKDASDAADALAYAIKKWKSEPGSINYVEGKMKATDKITLGKDEEFVINGTKVMGLEAGDSIEIRKKPDMSFECKFCGQKLLNVGTAFSSYGAEPRPIYTHVCRSTVNNKLYEIQVTARGL